MRVSCRPPGYGKVGGVCSGCCEGVSWKEKEPGVLDHCTAPHCTALPLDWIEPNWGAKAEQRRVEQARTTHNAMQSTRLELGTGYH